MTKQVRAVEKKIKRLMQQMTLQEKVGQLVLCSAVTGLTGLSADDESLAQQRQWLASGLIGGVFNIYGVRTIKALQQQAVENSRLGIPLLFGYDVIHGLKTLMPIPLAEAASWDLEAIEKSARIAAIEATAAGINWTFAPNVDISRDPRWGRVMEGAGEDPYLASQIAKMRVTGFQGQDLAAVDTLAACAKHFAGYGFVESGRDYNTCELSIATLYNEVLPPFQAALKAGVRSFMSAFSQLNGVPSTGDTFLQRQLLKGQWQFTGLMVSDFNSIVEMVDHGFARDSKHAAQIAINAGSDMDMESFSYGKYLEQLIEEGEVAKGLVEDAVARVLRVKFELGLFEDPYRYCDLKRQNRLLNHPEHHATALEIAKRSIVLLKNQGPLLPLAKQGMSIAVIGPLADDTNSSLGSWRLAADDYSGTSLFRALSAYEGNSTCYAKGAKLVLGEQKFTEDLHINQTDRTGFAEALAQAKQVDRVILVLGEHGLQSGEARSRADLGLPGLQQELMEKIYQVNQDIVLVLMNGRPLTISWATEHIPAIVEAWQLGSQSGPAIAQVLYGDYNPSGKLPMTFPRSVGQLPVYYYRKKTGRPTKKQGVFWSHYTDESNEPLYCFGYGLSYTQFSYANLVVKQQGPSAFNVQVTVANIGQYDGEEVVQLYLEDVVGSITRPQKQLKAFQKILLKKGESQLVNFKLDREVLGFFNAQGSFVVEPGEFRVWVGTNVSEGLSTTFELYRDDKAKISS